jgi:cytochrome c oxidase cbb3-type subunit III
MAACSKAGAAVCIAFLVLLAACEREARPFENPRVAAATAQGTDDTVLHAGGEPPSEATQYSPFRRNAWGIAEGGRLYRAYNCVGCHGHGGGGMGPALMDEAWIYGNQGANIHDSIVRGRPNGMPSFRNRIADDQVWMIAAYVQSMSENVPTDVQPGRTDHMQNRPSDHAWRTEPDKQAEPK